MKKNLPSKITVLFITVLLSSMNGLFAQQISDQAAFGLIRKNASALGLTKDDILNSRISTAYVDQISGASLVYVQQTYKGTDVFNSIQTYAFKNGKLVSAAGGRINKLEEIADSKTGKPSVTPGKCCKCSYSTFEFGFLIVCNCQTNKR